MQFFINLTLIVFSFINFSNAQETSNIALEVENIPKPEEISFLDKLFNKLTDDNNANEEIINSLLKTEIELNYKEGSFKNIALIRVIDKTIGRLYNLNIDVNSSVNIKEISIQVLKCWSPIQKTLFPEAKALINISEVINGKPNQIFYGWIFSESPSASQLSHSKFDVTLNSCQMRLAEMGVSLQNKNLN